MNKIKDILYDKNDILVALLIVAIAALVIYTRIEVIMDYPQIQAAAAESSSQAETKDKTSAQKNEQDAAGENESDKTAASEKQVNGTDSESAEQTNAPFRYCIDQYSLGFYFGFHCPAAFGQRFDFG